jgi:hypothetical protein
MGITLYSPFALCKNEEEKTMKIPVIFISLLFISGTMMFGDSASAEPVRCDQCTEAYPCATLFEFKNVRFTHKVFCSVDADGREQWDSNDYEKLDMFYFETPNQNNKQDKVTI